MISGFGAIAMSIGMIAAFLLFGGAVRLFRTGDKGKAGLMATAALVLIVNVLIWAW
jgi:hypothetical protein